MTPVLRLAPHDGLRRDRYGRLRWRIEARYPRVVHLVVAESTDRGLVLDLQSGDAAGTTGDADLDVQVARWIVAFISHGSAHSVVRSYR